MRKWLAFYFIAVLLLLMTVSASAYQLTIPEKTQVIEDEAFMNDTSLSVVVLPSKMISIGNKAFYGCKLSEVYMPDEIDYIADNAFGGNNGMTVYALPGSYAYQWAKQKGFTVDDPTPIVTGGFETNSLTVQCGNAINVKFNATCRFGYFHFLYLYIDSNYYQIDLPACEKYSNYIEIPLDKLNDSLEHEVEIYATYLDLDGYERGTTWLDSLHITQTVNDSQPTLTGGFTISELEVKQGDPINLPLVLTCHNGLITGIYISSDFDYGWWLGLPSPVSTYSGEINIPLDQLRDQLEHSASLFVTYSSLDGKNQYDQWVTSVTITQVDSVITDPDSEQGPEEGDDLIYPDNIEFQQHEQPMKIGETLEIAWTMHHSAPLTEETSILIWTSSNEAVATVVDGNVYAQGAGSTVITATTVNGLYDYCVINVEPDVQITGGFDEESIGIFVPNQGELRYHVNVQYGTLQSVKLKYGSRYLLKHDYSGQNSVSASFTITTGTDGLLDSTGKKTVYLVATAADGTEVTLGSASVYVQYDYPTRVIGVTANYTSGKIKVNWDNNGDATRYKIIYIVGGDVNVYSVDVSDPDATGGTITNVSAGKVYNIYVTAYNEKGSDYPSPRSEAVQVMTSDNSTPAVSARFVGGQTVYAPGETINIEVSYGNITKFHYQNYDHDYNSNGSDTLKYYGDYPSDESGWKTNRSGKQVVTLVAQNTPGYYCVEIFAKNLAETQATNSYNYTMGTGARCLMMTYTVQSGGLAAPTWSSITPKGLVEDVSYFFSKVTGATGYRVYRSAANDDSQAELIGTISNPPLTIDEQEGNSYYFVQAFNSAGNGPMSTGKRVDLRSSPATVSATLNKTIYEPGEEIEVTLTYSNIKKIHFQNDVFFNDNDYYDIWSDPNKKEEAQTSISGSKEVTLTAQQDNGNYSVKIWAINVADKHATNSYNGNGCLELNYTVYSDVAKPVISLKLDDEIYTDERNETYLSITAGSEFPIWAETRFSEGLNRLNVGLFDGGGNEIPIIPYQEYSENKNGRTEYFVINGDVDKETGNQHVYTPGIYIPENTPAGIYWLTAIGKNSGGETTVRVQIRVTKKLDYSKLDYQPGDYFTTDKKLHWKKDENGKMVYDKSYDKYEDGCFECWGFAKYATKNLLGSYGRVKSYSISPAKANGSLTAPSIETQKQIKRAFMVAGPGAHVRVWHENGYDGRDSNGDGKKDCNWGHSFVIVSIDLNGIDIIQANGSYNDGHGYERNYIGTARWSWEYFFKNTTYGKRGLEFIRVNYSADKNPQPTNDEY